MAERSRRTRGEPVNYAMPKKYFQSDAGNDYLPPPISEAGKIAVAQALAKKQAKEVEKKTAKTKTKEAAKKSVAEVAEKDKENAPAKSTKATKTKAKASVVKDKAQPKKKKESKKKKDSKTKKSSKSKSKSKKSSSNKGTEAAVPLSSMSSTVMSDMSVSSQSSNDNQPSSQSSEASSFDGDAEIVKKEANAKAEAKAKKAAKKAVKAAEKKKSAAAAKKKTTTAAKKRKAVVIASPDSNIQISPAHSLDSDEGAATAKRRKKTNSKTTAAKSPSTPFSSLSTSSLSSSRLTGSNARQRKSSSSSASSSSSSAAASTITTTSSSSSFDSLTDSHDTSTAMNNDDDGLLAIIKQKDASYALLQSKYNKIVAQKLAYSTQLQQQLKIATAERNDASLAMVNHWKSEAARWKAQVKDAETGKDVELERAEERCEELERVNNEQERVIDVYRMMTSARVTVNEDPNSARCKIISKSNGRAMEFNLTMNPNENEVEYEPKKIHFKQAAYPSYFQKHIVFSPEETPIFVKNLLSAVYEKE